MPNIVGTGQLSLVDINDAIISGTAPANPSIGTLWLDSSASPKLLKEWNGSAWIVKGEIMDEGTGETISDITETLGNMANDNVLDVQERQVIKDKLTEIIGYVIADTTTTLPTTATLDSSNKGGFYTVRKSALNAGLLSTDVLYTAVATKYNDLKSYLEGLTPIDPWDIRDSTINITVVKSTFRDKWLQYYIAVDALATATAQKLKQNVDDVKVGGTNLARNGDFSIPLNESLWNSELMWGDISEIVDVSTEAPPHQFALHVKTNSNKNGGYADADLFTGDSANAMVGKDITVSFWIKYSGIVQGVNTWNVGRFGELIVEGETATATKVYSYMQNMNITGTNTTWQKKEFTYRISLPASATKITKISLKHQLEACVGEFWTTGLKVEIGNKATDWSQSPYDVQARLVNVEFKVQDDQIISKVTSSEKLNLAINARADGQGFTFVKGVQGWRQDHALTQAVTGATVVNDGINGRTAIQITGQKWVFFGEPIIVNTSNIYKVKFRVKQTADPTTAGTSKVYAGVACFDVNKQPLTTSTFGTHRYCASAGQDLVVADGWKEYTGSISGEGDEGYNNFIPNTKYVVPMFIVNYNSGDGTVVVDECSLEDITDLETLGDRLNSVEQSITASGITTVIQESTFYENYTSEMAGKADTIALGDYAKTTDVETAIGAIDVEGQVESTIDTMSEDENSKLRVKFATKLELEETSTNITSKFSATGGMNLLKNSIGFADFTSWEFVGAGSENYIDTISTQELDTLGFGSGFQFFGDAGTTYPKVQQEVNVITGKPYTLSWYVKKSNLSTDGSFWVGIEDNGVKNEIKYMDATNGFESNFMTYTPTTNKIKIYIVGYGSLNTMITGLMFSIGDVALQWSLATGENYNTNVRLDINGIRVSQLNSDRREIGFTQITPDEFAGYYDADGDGVFEKVFYLNGDETVTKKLKALNEITMGTIKIIKVEAGGNMGWAFVPITEE